MTASFGSIIHLFAFVIVVMLVCVAPIWAETTPGSSETYVFSGSGIGAGHADSHLPLCVLDLRLALKCGLLFANVLLFFQLGDSHGRCKDSRRGESPRRTLRRGLATQGLAVPSAMGSRTARRR